MSKINRREFSRLVLAGAGATLLPAERAGRPRRRSGPTPHYRFNISWRYDRRPELQFPHPSTRCGDSRVRFRGNRLV